MGIRVSCACGKALNVPDEFAGKKAKCPTCHQVVSVPAEGGRLVTASCTCGKRISAPANLAGRRIKCPACQAVVEIPDAGGLDEDGEIGLSSDDEAVKCPSCGKEVGGGDVICISCGTNLKTGQSFKPMVDAPSAGRPLLPYLLGGAGLVALAGVILLVWALGGHSSGDSGKTQPTLPTKPPPVKPIPTPARPSITPDQLAKFQANLKNLGGDQKKSREAVIKILEIKEPARDLLAQALEEGPDSRVWIAGALIGLRDTRGITDLLRLAESREYRIRQTAKRFLRHAANIFVGSRGALVDEEAAGSIVTKDLANNITDNPPAIPRFNDLLAAVVESQDDPAICAVACYWMNEMAKRAGDLVKITPDLLIPHDRLPMTGDDLAALKERWRKWQKTSPPGVIPAPQDDDTQAEVVKLIDRLLTGTGAAGIRDDLLWLGRPALQPLLDRVLATDNPKEFNQTVAASVIVELLKRYGADSQADRLVSILLHEVESADDPIIGLRPVARKILREIRDRAVAVKLAEGVRKDLSPDRFKDVLEILRNGGAVPPEARDHILAALREPGPEKRQVRINAAHAIGSLLFEKADGELLGTLKDEDWEVRREAVQAIQNIARVRGADAAVVARLADLAQTDPDDRVKMKAILALGNVGGVEEARTLVTWVSNEDVQISANAVEALRALAERLEAQAAQAAEQARAADPGSPDAGTLEKRLGEVLGRLKEVRAAATPPLLARLEEIKRTLQLKSRIAILQALRWVGNDKEAVPELVKYLLDAEMDESVRDAAAQALLCVNTTETVRLAVPKLLDALNDESRAVRTSVGAALREITGQRFAVEGDKPGGGKGGQDFRSWWAERGETFRIRSKFSAGPEDGASGR